MLDIPGEDTRVPRFRSARPKRHVLSYVSGGATIGAASEHDPVDEGGANVFAATDLL